ncbi:MAG: nitroreductase [Candidatus Eisenbacteria bacterium]|nr:nitroreductase [Candidatus Eisenbacteria bacterium]
MSVRDVMEERRAYRSLDPAEISDEMLEDLFGCARIAPSCFNNQPWRYVFAREGEALEELKDALSKGNKWATAASMIVAVTSSPRFDCRIGKREYYLFDTGMATAFVILRATELGLVAHPIAGYSEKKAKRALGIPEDMRLITLVIVGRHASDIKRLLSDEQAETERSRPKRKAISEFAFEDRYDASFDEPPDEKE